MEKYRNTMLKKKQMEQKQSATQKERKQGQKHHTFFARKGSEMWDEKGKEWGDKKKLNILYNMLIKVRKEQRETRKKMQTTSKRKAEQKPSE